MAKEQKVSKEAAGDINITESLKKLSEIVNWFESEQGTDVEQGLIKVKEGAALISAAKKRLSKIENEFKEIQKEIAEEE